MELFPSLARSSGLGEGLGFLGAGGIGDDHVLGLPGVAGVVFDHGGDLLDAGGGLLDGGGLLGAVVGQRLAGGGDLGGGRGGLLGAVIEAGNDPFEHAGDAVGDAPGHDQAQDDGGDADSQHHHAGSAGGGDHVAIGPGDLVVDVLAQLAQGRLDLLQRGARLGLVDGLGVGDGGSPLVLPGDQLVQPGQQPLGGGGDVRGVKGGRLVPLAGGEQLIDADGSFVQAAVGGVHLVEQLGDGVAVAGQVPGRGRRQPFAQRAEVGIGLKLGGRDRLVDQGLAQGLEPSQVVALSSAEKLAEVGVDLAEVLADRDGGGVQLAVGLLDVGQQSGQFGMIGLGLLAGVAVVPLAERAAVMVGLDVQLRDLLVGEQAGDLLGPVEVVDLPLGQ
jgi:hypothetical protein